MAEVSSQSVIESFRKNGYCLVKGVFTGKELEGLEFDFDRIVHQLQESGENINARWSGAEMDKLQASDTVVIHTHNVQQYSSRWLNALCSESFLDGARALIGNDIVLHHSKLFQKPPEKGAPFPMHQDWGYFPTEKDTMLAAIIHVSDATDAMGCLRVYPGSHKEGRMDDSMGGRVLEKYPLSGATPVEAEAGDVLFFSYLTVHGSMPNVSDKTRKTVLIQMHSGDDKVEDGNLHPNESLVLSGWNYRMTRERVTN